MTKIVTIHQPNYIPWMGFFGKVNKSDIFVILDSVEYTKNSVINRNKVRIKDGWCYLTIPIEKKYHESRIVDVKLPLDDKWRKNHWATIESNYNKTDYFHTYKDFLKRLYEKKCDFLWQINEEAIIYLMKCFNIDVEIIKASELELNPELKKTDLLISILKSVEGDRYISGPSGKNYLEIEKFKQGDIELEFFEFKHPEYKQRYPGFVPNLSAIDLLFNMGEKSSELI